MLYQNDVFVGVDVSSGTMPYIVAVINNAGNLLALEKCALDEALKFCAGYGTVIVAVNASRSIMKMQSNDQVFQAADTLKPVILKSRSYRNAEWKMKSMGIRFTKSPARNGSLPPCITNGIKFYQQVEQFIGSSRDGRSIIETNAQASFHQLLGRPPLQRNNIEGRIQRQLTLLDGGIKLPDPMSFYEEVTRYRLLHGILPDEMLFSPRQLDALICSLVARISFQDPENILTIGDDTGGWVVLPSGSNRVTETWVSALEV